MQNNRIAVIFITHHKDTVGNNNRLFQIEYLNTHFTIDIFTNVPDFIKTKFPNNSVIGIKNLQKCKMPIIDELFDAYKISKQINREKDYNGVYMIFDQSIVARFIKYPAFVYIHQYGIRRVKSNKSPKKIIKDYLDNLLNKIRIKSLKHANKIFVVSENIKKLLEDHGLKNKEIIITPHGVNINRFNNPFISDIHQKQIELKKNNKKILCYVGRLNENTGIYVLLNSVKKMIERNNNIYLIIAGTDKVYTEKIENFKKQNNLENNIINHGVLDAMYIPAILKYSDICYNLWNTSVEGYHYAPPQKITEYLAAGKPVICNKITPHELLIKNKINGLIIEYDENSLISATMYLLENDQVYNELSENAIKSSNNLDANIVYKKMAEEIKKAIN